MPVLRKAPNVVCNLMGHTLKFKKQTYITAILDDIMGMTGNFLRVTRTELDEYLKDSSLLENRIYNDESEDVDPKLVDIDKSWHGILFLLTGQNFENYDHPLTKIFFSGQIIDEDQDLGYGPGQYLTPEQVKELNVELAEISTAELKSRYDPKKMTDMDIYPNAWDEDGIVDYLTDYFQIVQQVFSDATKNDEAIIAFIS